MLVPAALLTAINVDVLVMPVVVGVVPKLEDVSIPAAVLLIVISDELLVIKPAVVVEVNA